MFPFIEFEHSKTYIKLTCHCLNSKKILIKDLFNINNNYILFDNSEDDMLSSTQDINFDNDTNEYYKGFMCTIHNSKYKNFCKTCLINLCEECSLSHKDKPHNLINLENIELDNEDKINIIKKINPDNFNDSNNIIKTIKIKKVNDSRLIKKDEDEDEKEFNKLVRIIINDSIIYPNYLHFFNLQNIIRFFNAEQNEIITEKIMENKEKININKNNNIFNDKISIKYINNINGKTILFGKKFVENNIDKAYLKIEGEYLELIEGYSFKSNEKIITITLIIGNEISKIDLTEMFSNCINLISINGLSQWKKTKMINLNKMFYNCTSLLYIPDFKDWDISEVYDTYLMFYNCISLIFFPNLLLNDLYCINNNYDSGLLFTKYLQSKNEIKLKTYMNKEYNINLFGNKIFIKNEKDIIVIQGNNYDLILCSKNNEKSFESKNELIILYNNNLEKTNFIEIELKIKIYNKINNIFTNNTSVSKSDLPQWITNNIIDMSYLFYNCESLESLPDISNWNTYNVKNNELYVL